MVRDSINWDKRISWATAIPSIAQAANGAIKNILSLSPSVGTMLSITVALSILVAYALCWKEMQRRSFDIFWRSVGLFACIYTLSAILITIQGDPIDLMINGTASLTFGWFIPVGVLACSVKDKDVLYEIWVKASYIMSCFALCIFFFHRPNEEALISGATEYNSFYSGCVMLPLLIQLTEYVRTKNKYLLLLSVFEVVTIFLYANRGVLFSLFFLVIYKFAFESDSRFRKIISVILLLFFGYVMTASIQSISQSLVDFLAIFDVKSRTLEVLAGGVFDDTSGRDTIWKVCFNMIEERPLFGWGMGGEYYHISQTVTGTIEENLKATTSHPHNSIIQNFVCFGVFGGLIATIIMLYPLFHLKKTKNRSVHDLLVIFASSSIIPGCISMGNALLDQSTAMFLYLFYFENHCKKGKETI